MREGLVKALVDQGSRDWSTN